MLNFAFLNAQTVWGSWPTVTPFLSWDGQKSTFCDQILCQYLDCEIFSFGHNWPMWYGIVPVRSTNLTTSCSILHFWTRKLCGEVDPPLSHFSRGMVKKVLFVTRWCVYSLTAKYLALHKAAPLLRTRLRNFLTQNGRHLVHIMLNFALFLQVFYRNFLQVFFWIFSVGYAPHPVYQLGMTWPCTLRWYMRTRHIYPRGNMATTPQVCNMVAMMM
jgi:hypothetical protein